MKLVQAAIQVGGLEAIAHITGGGMDNVPRALPKGTVAKLKSWPVPAPFLEVMKRSGMSWSSMLTTLNCGIGMTWIVQPEKFDALLEVCSGLGFKAFDLGLVEKGIEGSDSAWELVDSSWQGYDS